MTELTNKTALVTGASRGIGAAITRHFAANGANVVMLARSGQALSDLAEDVSDAGGRAMGIQGDVSVYADVQRAVSTAIEHFGRLDILVNNAGVIEPITRLADSAPDT